MTRSVRCDRSESGASTYPGYVLRRVTAWLRRHPSQADGLLAAALLVFSVSQLTASAPDALERACYVAVTVLLAATVALRRRYPVAAFSAAVAIGAAQVAFGVRIGGTGRVFALQPNNADLAIPVLLYTLAAFRPRPVSITGLVICLLGAVAAITRWSPAHRANAGEAVLGAAIGLGGLSIFAVSSQIAGDRAVVGIQIDDQDRTAVVFAGGEIEFGSDIDRDGRGATSSAGG